MKEVICVVIILLLLTTDLVACGEDRVVKNIHSELAAKQAYIEGITPQIDDNEFWQTTHTAVNLVQDTIEERRSVSTSFRLEFKDPESGETERITTAPVEICLEADTTDRRDLIATGLVIGLVDDRVLGAYAKGEIVRVTGVLISWSQRKSLINKTPQYFSAVDLDIDGAWDYVCAQLTSFSGAAHFSMPEFELTDVDAYDLCPVDKAATLSELRRLAN